MTTFNCSDCEQPSDRAGLCEHCRRCPAGADCAEENCMIGT